MTTVLPSRWQTVVETDRLFRVACELAKTPPTQRQASKFYKGRGKAFAAKNAAKLELIRRDKETNRTAYREAQVSK